MAIVAAIATFAQEPAPKPALTAAQTEQITNAAPQAPIVKPEKPRKLLVFTLTRGFHHDSIPCGLLAMQVMAQKTGAFETTPSEDIAVFEKDSLNTFDGVLFLNTTGEVFTPPDLDKLAAEQRTEAEQRAERLQENLRHFVEDGKGLIGIHSAADTLYKWDWYGQALGGYFDGHPWNADTEVVIRVDDPKHPVVAAFGGVPLSFKEELYQFREPYSRKNQRVLLSLDTRKTDMTKPGIKRTDRDFAVSWVRTQGKGRVFYTSLGHNAAMYSNPAILKHYLAGIQCALGDLPCDTTPIPAKTP